MVSNKFRFEPTYKELKPQGGGFISLVSSRFEPTYKELKHDIGYIGL